MQITFTIPEDKVDRVVNAIVGLHPIPLDENEQPEFTPNQWAKERTRRWIRDQVARWERKVIIDALPFNPDDSVVS